MRVADVGRARDGERTNLRTLERELEGHCGSGIASAPRRGGHARGVGGAEICVVVGSRVFATAD